MGLPDFSGLVAWTSAPGIARSLYVNRSLSVGVSGVAARMLLFLLIVIPLVLGLVEIVLGIVYRHQDAACAYPLTLWVIVDGLAALLTAVLSLIDITRVYQRQREENDDVDDDAARRERAASLGSYACTGLTVIFLIPLFRLIWLLYGLDIIYRIDPSSFASFFHATLRPGACNVVLFSIMFYYIEVVTLVILTLTGLIVAFALLLIIRQLCRTNYRSIFCSNCCCRSSHAYSPLPTKSDDEKAN